MTETDFDPVKAWWRVGRKVGRTVYALVPSPRQDPDDDVLIGVFDTRELAVAAVSAHNASLHRRLGDFAQLKAAVYRAGFEVLEDDFVLRDGSRSKYLVRGMRSSD